MILVRLRSLAFLAIVLLCFSYWWLAGDGFNRYESSPLDLVKGGHESVKTGNEDATNHVGNGEKDKGGKDTPQGESKALESKVMKPEAQKSTKAVEPTTKITEISSTSADIETSTQSSSQDLQDGTTSNTSSAPTSGPANGVYTNTTAPTASKPKNSKPDPTIEVSKLQAEYYKSYDQKELKAGAIYGNTLKQLVNRTLTSSYLHATNFTTKYHKASPYTYNPYPDYTSAKWKSENWGSHETCEGPHGRLPDLLAFAGQLEVFAGEPQIGSYSELKIDSGICFERATKLGPYGLKDEDEATHSPGETEAGMSRRESTDWDSVDWGSLQDKCIEKNSKRFSKAQKRSGPFRNTTSSGTHSELRDMMKPQARTAFLLRSFSNKNYTENDKQNIRSLITELSLKSGGEYQAFLLVHVRNESLPIYTDQEVYNKVIEETVPKEFQKLAVLWNLSTMNETYPKMPKPGRNVHRAQYFPVQLFAKDHLEFEYFWNWELDVRYTGNHYDLFEKLSAFGKAQPRKYLWERNERYYIPSIHGNYSTQFRERVANVSGSEIVWGAPVLEGVTPTGPKPPVYNPHDDNYQWGVGEAADYISLAPMFNPVGTKWFMKDEVWNYQGKEKTPRRTVIGTQSRLSRKLVTAMHTENEAGNHVASEMGGATVALLHGLKGVYAPVPMFFDRTWPGEELDKFFNPGPKGQSGSSEESPFSFHRESRFRGSTYYYRATPPQRLHNHWMGLADSGIGGPEWEEKNGRPCLPAMLLHPVKLTNETLPGYSSESIAW